MTSVDNTRGSQHQPQPQQQQLQQTTTTTATTATATCDQAANTKLAVCTCDRTSASLIPQVGSSMGGQQISADSFQPGAAAPQITGCQCQSDCPNCAASQLQTVPVAQYPREPNAQQLAKQVALKQGKQLSQRPHQHHWPIPVRVFLEPRNDESVRCDCRNCQFFSGWCCMPCALFIIILILVFWATSKWSAPPATKTNTTTTTTATTTSTSTTSTLAPVSSVRSLDAFYTIF